MDTEQQPTAQPETSNALNTNGKWQDPVDRVAGILERNAAESLERMPASEEPGPESAPESESPDTDSVTEIPAPDTPGAPGADTEAEPEQAPEPAAAIKLAGLAEKLGVTVEDLYNVEFDVDIGENTETITLGQFKDHARDLFDVENRQTALAAQKMEHEEAVLSDQKELLAMINESGVELSPELRARAGQAQQAYQTQQRELLFSMLPEWRGNSEQYQADRAEMVETLGKHYEWTEAMIGAQSDASLIKAMLDLTRFHKIFAESDAIAKRIPSVPRRPGKPRRGAIKRAEKRQDIVNKGAASDNPDVKRNQVAALLNEPRG